MAGRLPNFARALAAINKVADQGARLSVSPILRAFGLELVGQTKAMLSQPGQGRWYGKHQASKPGDPPAVDTGRLRNSIAMDWVDARTLRVGTGVVYAEFLELGDVEAGLAPRPFFRPALEATRAIFKDRGLPNVVGGHAPGTFSLPDDAAGGAG